MHSRTAAKYCNSHVPSSAIRTAEHAARHANLRATPWRRARGMHLHRNPPCVPTQPPRGVWRRGVVCAGRAEEPIRASCRLRGLDCHVHLDLRVRVVALNNQVVKGAALHRVDAIANGQRGERARRALQLLLERIDVVQVDVRVANRVHESAALEARQVGEDACQQRVPGAAEARWKGSASLCRSLVAFDTRGRGASKRGSAHVRQSGGAAVRRCGGAAVRRCGGAAVRQRGNAATRQRGDAQVRR